MNRLRKGAVAVIFALGAAALYHSGFLTARSRTPEDGNQTVAAPATVAQLRDGTLQNPAAYIPAQCYTKTRDEHGRIHNPCFSCHTAPLRPNYVNDADLQLSYDFPLLPQTNRWNNLFKDRRAAIAKVGDTEILDYIRTSNYFDAAGQIVPATKLVSPPENWDYDANQRWEGFIPDAHFSFDAKGFDRDAAGNPTGWRAFAYYPFPGTFWPTNGSTSDVLIRLPPAFRTNFQGEPDQVVYQTNLAIVEAIVKEKNVPINPVDETALGGIDLDQNGRLGIAKRVVYAWAPLQNRLMWYVGQALEQQRKGKVHLAAGLYPEGTEFLHTVRYIDVDESGDNRLAARMKEVRYARKSYWMSYADLQAQELAELKEKHDFPDRLRTVRGNREAGVSNGQGWVYAAMIEDAQGDLRPQTYEELSFCVGCHGGIGANRDGIFSFHRKFDHPAAQQQGWYHWSQKSLRGTPERRRTNGEPEYAFYLAVNGAGDEFRGNEEIIAKFFASDGRLRPEPLMRLREDISTLLYASRRRAMELNKAYREIVKEQSFIEGRDAVPAPVADAVHRDIPDGETTGIEKPVAGY